MTSGTGHNLGFSRHGREKSGQRPQVSGHVGSGPRAPTNEDSTKFGALPKLDGHMLVDANSLKFEGKTLQRVDLLCYVVKTAIEEMLENRLETGTPWNPRKIGT